jgi:hypothetical protein
VIEPQSAQTIGVRWSSHDADIVTLDLRQAADFLKMHWQTLQERARAGKIPGASKPGKRWVFQEAGLIDYLNQHSPCPYIASEKSGTSTSPRNGAEFDALLGLPTRKRHRNTTTRSRGAMASGASSEKARP